MKTFVDIVSEWSGEDKRKLLTALEKHGNDVAAIHKVFPNKSITAIRAIFDKYTQLASNKMNEEEKQRSEDSAINQWIGILKKLRPKSGLVDIMPRALKYIALFEKRPIDPDVNLKDCYFTLSDMLSGSVSKNLDPTTNIFFYDNLARLAIYMNKANTERQKDFVRNIKGLGSIKSKTVRTYKRKRTGDIKENVILNPLNIPDELLQMLETEN